MQPPVFSIHRRRFLVGLAAAAGVVAVGGPLAWLVRPHDRRNTNVAPEALDRALLYPLRGKRVEVLGSGRAVHLDVTEVSALRPYSGPRPSGVDGDVFSITFSGSGAERLDQGTYDFRHASVGTFPLFIVPVDLVEGGTQTYEAIFNRIH